MNRTHTANQDGVALIAAIFVGVILVVLSTLLITVSISEMHQSTRQVRLASASQAAEAGLDDYVSKLTQNAGYPLQYVHPAERARRNPTTGALTLGGQPWTGGLSWIYPTGAPTTWKRLSNGYEYSLQVVPPSPGQKTVTVRASGRKVGTSDTRTYEARIRTASVLDYEHISQGDLRYAPDATTNGKVYVGGDLTHPGIAQADVLAEGQVRTVPTLQNGARWFDRNTIRSQIANPIPFSSFVVSLTVVKSAAASGGISLTDPTANAWRLKFRADGTVAIEKCTSGPTSPDSKLTYYGMGSGGLPIPCSAYAIRPVPANGAIYSDKTLMVSGTVNGRVTVVSNEDILLDGPTNYVNGLDDTLGMIPKRNMKIAFYIRANTPSSLLEWWGSVLVLDEPYRWESMTDGRTGPPGINAMIHHGSAIFPQTGAMSWIPNRTYAYDPNLQFLQPPYFPLLEDSYTLEGFREVPSTP